MRRAIFYFVISLQINFMIYRIALTVVFTSSLNLIHAQTPGNDPRKTVIQSNENYEIIGDVRLNEMEERLIKINSEQENIDGFRLQLFSSSGPNSYNQANEVQTKFLEIYEEIPAYVVHKKPAFKVRVGDFRTRLEAERFFIELKENFPDAFVVKDQINLPPLLSEDENMKDD